MELSISKIKPKSPRSTEYNSNSHEWKIDADNIVHLNPDEMKEALSKIAQEVHRFCAGMDTGDELIDEVDIYKSKLYMKDRQINNLKDNLNIACSVAKSLTLSKEKECVTLNKHLTETKNENLTLQKENSEYFDMIQKLKNENYGLSKKFEQLSHFINLGYNELQKIRNEPIKELSIELCLKEILVSCGQFYADYCNEHEKNYQLDQKNRFLTSRLCIIERDLEAAKEHLNRCGKSTTKINPSKTALNKKAVNSELIVKKLRDSNGIVESGDPSDLDLSAHMTIVKDLLNTQDSMLVDLKELAKELQCLNG